jgi:hypothetical protein
MLFFAFNNLRTFADKHFPCRQGIIMGLLAVFGEEPNNFSAAKQ